MTLADALVSTSQLDAWLHDTGPSLGLVIGPKALPACWAQHPVARHEITGLFLAWSSLGTALNPEAADAFTALALPGPRDFLDLSNASAAAVARALAAGATCARAGHHVGERH